MANSVPDVIYNCSKSMRLILQHNRLQPKVFFLKTRYLGHQKFPNHIFNPLLCTLIKTMKDLTKLICCSDEELHTAESFLIVTTSSCVARQKSSESVANKNKWLTRRQSHFQTKHIIAPSCPPLDIREESPSKHNLKKKKKKIRGYRKTLSKTSLWNNPTRCYAISNKREPSSSNAFY